MTKPSAAAKRRYDRLFADVSARVEASDSTMFGMPTMKLPSGKAFCGIFGEDMVFKLPDEGVRAEAMDLPGAAQFDPSGGRPMREWVRLGPEHEDTYLDLALSAARTVK